MQYKFNIGDLVQFKSPEELIDEFGNAPGPYDSHFYNLGQKIHIHESTGNRTIDITKYSQKHDFDKSFEIDRLETCDRGNKPAYHLANYGVSYGGYIEEVLKPAAPKIQVDVLGLHSLFEEGL